MHGCIGLGGIVCMRQCRSKRLLVWQGIGGSVKFPRSDIRAFGFRIPVHIVVRVRPANAPGCSRDGRRRAWCEWKLVYALSDSR